MYARLTSLLSTWVTSFILHSSFSVGGGYMYLFLLSHLFLYWHCQYVVTHEGKTFLPHFLGLYRLTVNGAESYWIVMRNVLNTSVRIHKKFDLKGSTVDRSASDKEKVNGLQ